MNPLLDKHCRDYSKNESPLSADEIEKNLIHTPKWQFFSKQKIIKRTYTFKNYQQTMAFVNQVAEIAKAQDHHPDMLVSYNRCDVSYNTHTVDGITENDFICAAQIDVIDY